MEPTKKSPMIEDLLESISGRTTAIKSNNCIPPPIGCGKPITRFRDDISVREYQISGFCQECQDKVFGVSDE